MSLLDQIKKQTKKENVLDNHPISKVDFEGKFNYLRGLALFMVIDEKITDDEKSLWKKLIKTFDCGEFEEQLEGFLDNPDITELDAIIDSIQTNNVSSLFMLDALLICYSDSNYADQEDELLNVFSEKIGIIKQEVEFLHKFAKAVSEKDYQAIVAVFHNILKESILEINTDHLDYFLDDFDDRKEMERVIYGIEFSLQKGLFSLSSSNSTGLEIHLKYETITKDHQFSMLLQVLDKDLKKVECFEEDIQLSAGTTNSYCSFTSKILEVGAYSIRVFIDAKEYGTSKIKVVRTEYSQGNRYAYFDILNK